MFQSHGLSNRGRIACKQIAKRDETYLTSGFCTTLTVTGLEDCKSLLISWTRRSLLNRKFNIWNKKTLASIVLHRRYFQYENERHTKLILWLVLKSQLTTTTELTSSSKLKPSSISPSFNVAFLLAQKREKLTEKEAIPTSFQLPMITTCQNTSQLGGQTCATCCTLQYCNL